MANALTRKLASPGRLWDWLAALLVVAAAMTAARRLIVTEWTEHLGRVQTLAFLGAIAGLLIGYSRFNKRQSIFFAVAYGLFAIPWQLGQILSSQIAWRERMESLAGRLGIAIVQMTNDKNVTDPLLFLMLMGALFWALSVVAGYSLTRAANPWRAVIPLGIGIVILHTYDPLFPVRMWYLAVFLFFSLLLVARVHYLGARSAWQKTRTHLPLYVGVDMLRATAAAAGVLIVLAWAAPALAASLDPAERAWQRITEPWQNVRNDVSRAFTSLKASVGVISDYYGENLPLGRGNSRSNQTVMTIETPLRPSSSIRLYWRARAYDYYDSQDGWDVTLADTLPVTPERYGLNYPAYEGRWLVTGKVETLTALSVLYSAAEPRWVSRPAELSLGFGADGTPDIVSIRADDPLLGGETYEFEASVTAASINQLRAAGTNYPAWVTERYLQIPDTITPRTLALAQAIAADLETPYDIAEAVTQYLRDNITYSETVPELPLDQEPIDWVLFDLKQGFCNYYATAEVILLRSLGIPARLAVGYSEGERTLGAQALDVLPGDETGVLGGETLSTEIYSVQQSNLHAWPEVYFPGMGWVEFEPTVSQLPLVRPEGEEFVINPVSNGAENPIDEQQDLSGQDANLPGLGLGDDPTANDLAALQRLGVWLPIAGLAAVIALAALTWRAYRRRGGQALPILVEQGLLRIHLRPPLALQRWAYWARLEPLERAYVEINRALARLGQPPPRNATPAERAEALTEMLPDLAEPIYSLRNAYQTKAYGARSVEDQTAILAGRLVRSASWVVRLRRWLARWQQPPQREDLVSLAGD